MKKKQRKEKQNDQLGIIKNYWRSLNLNKKRKRQEILYPIIIAIIVSFIYCVFSSESTSERITKIHSSISSVVAIQIGFIITSLALIASFGEKAGEKAFRKINQSDIYKQMELIINSFVYNVAVYICLLMLGFIHLFLIEPLATIVFTKYGLNEIIKNILKYFYFGSLVFLILHGFIVFMRNVKLIQLYLLAVLKNNKEEL